VLEVAHAVLEADQVLVAVGQCCHRGVLVDGVGPVVDDNAEGRGAADGADVLGQSGLVRLGQVRREEQESVGAGCFGSFRVLDGLGGGSAGGGEDRNLPAHFFDGGADYAL
jgi:hypothetical protein